MKKIDKLTVFTGHSTVPIDLIGYTKVFDNSIVTDEYVEVIIDFYKGNMLVRRMYNPSCDIVYNTGGKA